MKTLKTVRLEHDKPSRAIFVWLLEDGEIDVHVYAAPPGVLLDIEDHLREQNYRHDPCGNIMHATYLHPDIWELNKIPEPSAGNMWCVQNKRYMAWGRTYDDVWGLREEDKRLKNGRISQVLQMYPSLIRYHTVYHRGAIHRTGDPIRAPEIAPDQTPENH